MYIRSRIFVWGAQVFGGGITQTQRSSFSSSFAAFYCGLPLGALFLVVRPPDCLIRCNPETVQASSCPLHAIRSRRQQTASRNCFSLVWLLGFCYHILVAGLMITWQLWYKPGPATPVWCPEAQTQPEKHSSGSFAHSTSNPSPHPSFFSPTWPSSSPRKRKKTTALLSAAGWNCSIKSSLLTCDPHPCHVSWVLCSNACRSLACMAWSKRLHQVTDPQLVGG